MVDVNVDLQIKEIFSESFDNNLNYDFAYSKTDQNNSFRDDDEYVVKTKHELNIHNGQNFNDLSHNSKRTMTYSIEENKDQITSNEYNSDKFRDQYIPNIDNQVQTDCIILTDFRASSDHFTDSGCFSSQSTIEDDKNAFNNAIDMFPKESMKNCNLKNENYINPINVTHMEIDEIEDGNLERDITLKSEFKDVDLEDSNCSGYHSSDFEFIDEHDAKEIFNNSKLDANINKSYYDSKPEVSLQSTEDRRKWSRSKSFSNCQNHIIPEGDGFLVLFQTAPAHYYKKSFMKHNCYNFVPSSSRSRLGFEIEKLEEFKKHNEGDVREAKETVKKILSMYPRHNRYYKIIL